MPIVWPDNPNREERVIQLGTDIEDYLQEAMQSYDDFKTDLDRANKLIRDAYEKSGLAAPGVGDVALLEKGDIEGVIDTANTVVKVVDILVGVGGFAVEVKYLAPAVVRGLVKSGLLSPEKAAQVVIKFGSRVLARDIEVTFGDIAGNLIGGVLGGIAVAGIDIGIEAIEGAVLHDKLVKGIHDLYPVRTSIRVSEIKARYLAQSVASVNTSLDALDAAGALSENVLKAVIEKSVEPAVARAQEVDAAKVGPDLKKYDIERKSYIADDPAG